MHLPIGVPLGAIGAIDAQNVVSGVYNMIEIPKSKFQL